MSDLERRSWREGGLMVDRSRREEARVVERREGGASDCVSGGGAYRSGARGARRGLKAKGCV